jgi:hypothetical protein
MATQWEVDQHSATWRTAQLLRSSRPGRSAARADRGEAADILFELISLDICVPLTTERGRPPERWERWGISRRSTAGSWLPMVLRRRLLRDQPRHHDHRM